jgi:hypothetical protein
MPPIRALAFALALGILAVASASRAEPTPPPPETIVLPPRAPSTPITLDVGAHGGVTARLGEIYNDESRTGFLVGASAWINPSSRYGIGLEFSHQSLGQQRSPPGPHGEVEISRFTNAAWAGLRLDFVHLTDFEGWIGIGPGLVWDTSDSSGIANVSLGQPGKAFACSGTDGPHFGLRGSVGSAIALGGGVHLAPEIVVEGDQLGSDSIGNCVAGPGTVGVLSFRLGFFIRSDVSRNVR